MQTNIDSELSAILERIPPRNEPYLPTHWLRDEMIERYHVLSHAKIRRGMNVLEVGAGGHAIATVPLAHLVGEAGRIVAVEIERWHDFQEIVRASGLWKRIVPLAIDATRLPFPFECFDMSIIVHGVRSMRSETVTVGILKEMLRVAPRIFVAESLPLARTKAQESHLEMYNLREEIFEAMLGAKDDIHYPSMDSLVKMVGMAGGRIESTNVLELPFPHYLAYIPREYVEKISDAERRSDLLHRWDVAYRKLQEHGEEHPPVGVVEATRADLG